MKSVLIINGPNLNLLGKREKEIYGSVSFKDFFDDLNEAYSDFDLSYFQSNIEGEIIDRIQQADQKFDAVILNAGGYTHTSVAIRDAVAAISTPVIEVHISNPYSREEFRKVSLISEVCVGVIAGFGLESYALALDSLI
ncbi:MAG: type II 3-dehydroquinate dehydratase [Chitinophagales bacterium]|nr:type II 3-dehydroquinate dehydratase [Chitinophagales bacterium]